jgi:hypothetical protein
VLQIVADGGDHASISQLTCCNLVVSLSEIVCFFTVSSSSSMDAVACLPDREAGQGSFSQKKQFKLA